MARSWRNFFRRGTDEEQEKGSAVTREPEPSTEEGNGHVPTEVEATVQEAVEDVPAAEEVQAERKEPAPAEVWEVEEPEAGEVEDALPEPSAVEEVPDAEAVVEAQESSGWFGRLKKGLIRSRESFVGQLNAAVAEFRDVEDEEFWEKVE
jgi:fused signal recognition particle receptor